MLTNEQQGILHTLVGHIKQGEGGMYNLDAPEGSVKTSMVDVLLSRVQMKEKIAIACGMSGIYAILLRKGTTLLKS